MCEEDTGKPNMHLRTLINLTMLLAALSLSVACEQAQKSWRYQPPPELKIAHENRPESAGLEIVEGNILVTIAVVDEAPAVSTSDDTAALSAGEWDSESYTKFAVIKLSSYWAERIEKTMEFHSTIPGVTVYRAVVNRDGSLSSLELLSGSGSEHYDLAARDALQQPYPGLFTEFQPLPAEFTGQSLTFEITFYAHTSPQPKEEKER
jgi:hypothetical protein